MPVTIPIISASGAKSTVVIPDPVVSSSGFVQVQGTQLVLDGKPFIIHGATAYGDYHTDALRKAVVKLAKENGMNTLELVRYSRIYNSLASETASDTWTAVDAFIAEVRASNMKVILNLSGYYWALKASGTKPTSVDWSPFLQFVMNRVNTVTGVKYSNDPTIAMIELIGEIDDPNGTEPTLRPTNAEMLVFFRRTLDQLRVLTAKHVLCTGGFSYLNIGRLDWKPLMALANNQVCAFEINSFSDRDITAPMVTQYAKDIGKPWWLAAFSSCRRPSNGSYDINSQPTDALCAAHHREMYEVARGRFKSVTPGVGSDFWSLSSQDGICDINPKTPLTLAVVREYAP